MKKYCRMVLLIIVGLSFSTLNQAKSLNHILSESDTLKLSDKVPALVGNELVFERIEGETSSVWVFDRLSGDLRPLNIQSPIEIIAFKGQALIISELNEYKIKVSAYSDNSREAEILFDIRKSEPTRLYGTRINQSNDAFYVFHSFQRYGKVTRYDGDQLIEYWDQNADPFTRDITTDFNTCEIGDDYFSHAVSWHQLGTWPGSGYYYSLLVKNQDEFIPLSETWWFSDVRLEVVNGSCFISGYDWELEETILVDVFGPDGVMRAVDRSSMAANLSRFQFKNGFVYAVGKSNDAGIYKLHPETLEVIQFQPILNSSELNVYPTLVVSGERLITSLQEKEVFDLDLNKIDRGTTLPLIHTSDEVALDSWSDVTVVANQNNMGEWLSNSEPKFSIITAEQKITQFASSQTFKMNDIKIDSFAEKVLVSGVDFQSKKYGYYVLEDQPQISAAINGAWYDPAMANQGVALNKGIRHDGSEYVFVTAYLFENGVPLWLAGTAELSSNAVDFTVALYRFSGLNMLEPGTDPAAHEFFGDMKLSLSNCNTLNIELSDAFDVHDLTMIRADNVMYKNWCQD